MAPVLGALKWYTMAAVVRDAVYAVLDPPPCRYGVVPGSIAWDGCECGALYVSVLNTFLSDVFPMMLEEPVGVGCDASQEVAVITVQVLRCAPGPDTAGNPPTPAQLDTCAQQIAADSFNAVAAVEKVLCGMKNKDDILEYLLRETAPVGPDGGCVGTEINVSVALPRG